MPTESASCPLDPDSGDESDFWPNIGRGEPFYLMFY